MPASDDTAIELIDQPREGDLLDGRYRLQRRLGQGGFATVYSAEDTEAGGTVAVKILSAELGSDPAFVARFGQEIALVRQLRHPNVVQVWDVGLTDEGHLFMVMELLKGTSLRDALDDSGAIGSERALDLLENILMGLAAAHDEGIVHRDVKPENIFLCALDGEPDHVKLLDFGIAKALPTELASVKTKTGMVMGTPGYTAPEVLMGEPVTPSADVYSAGLVLAELLSGSPVIAHGPAAKMLWQQMSLDVQELTRDMASGPTAALLHRLLDKNPDGRFSDAGETLSALRLARSGGDVAALPTASAAAGAENDPPPTDRTSRPVPKVSPERGRPWLLAMLLTVAVLGLALSILLLGDRNDERPSDDVAEPSARLDSPEVATAVDTEPSPPAYAPLGDLPGASLDTLGWDWLGDEAVAAEPARVASRSEPTSDEAEAPEPPSPRSLLLESTRYSQQAIDLLEWGLASDQIDPERRDEASDQLLAVYQVHLGRLIEMGQCRAAASRLDHALSLTSGLPPAAHDTLAPLHDLLASCQAPADAVTATWEPAAYFGLVRLGNERYSAARAVPPEDRPARDALLLESLQAHRQAYERLLAGLSDPQATPQARLDMQRNRTWLDGRIISLEAALGRCSAARLQLDGRDTTPAVADGGDDPGRVAATDPETTALSETIDACYARTQAEISAFSWDLVNLWLSLSEDLFNQAMALLALLRHSERPAYSVELRVTSDPPGAHITLDGEVIGRTPFEGRVESDDTRVVLSLRRPGHHGERLRLDLSEPQSPQHVELRPRDTNDDSPFGRLRPLGGI